MLVRGCAFISYLGSSYTSPSILCNLPLTLVQHWLLPANLTHAVEGFMANISPSGCHHPYIAICVLFCSSKTENISSILSAVATPQRLWFFLLIIILCIFRGWLLLLNTFICSWILSHNICFPSLTHVVLAKVKMAVNAKPIRSGDAIFRVSEYIIKLIQKTLTGKLCISGPTLL